MTSNDLSMKNETCTIQVFGSGCPSCKRLHELTQRAVQELGMSVEVEYVTDVQRLIELGVMQSPVLAINGKPVLAGSVSDIETIKEVITQCKDGAPGASDRASGCSCGGGGCCS